MSHESKIKVSIIVLKKATEKFSRLLNGQFYKDIDIEDKQNVPSGTYYLLSGPKKRLDVFLGELGDYYRA